VADDPGAAPRSVGPTELVELAAFTLALAGYVYLAGWLVTWVRFAAARLPVDSSLPIVGNKVVFTSGLRMVLTMAVVFGAMCALAYAVHAWTWAKRAPEWHRIVRNGRANARKEALANSELPPVKLRVVKPRLVKPSVAALKFQSAPEGIEQAPMGDPFVRVIAGFNVGVLAAAIGLAGGRLAKTVIDQIVPGQWWALVGPWALISLLAALLLALVRPLRGGPVVQALTWAGVIAVALVSSAPIGLLVLTWAGIATFGRRYGQRQQHPRSNLEFALSPLPWILLVIYALVGLAYYAMPPVSFSRIVLDTPAGARLGGYLTRNEGGVYFVSCTPLADATSTNEAVTFVRATDVTSTSSGGTTFLVDSGYRPSLPTLAFHLFGVNAQIPAWIRPELKARRGTCAGAPSPRPSIGSEQPQLGAGVFSGPVPPGGQARDGEPPIGQTTPAIATLARRFQPTIMVSVADRFWPVSVGALLEDRGRGGEYTCLHRVAKGCVVRHPSLKDLSGQGSAPGDYLEYPARPTLSPDPTGQLDAFLRGQLGRQIPLPSLHAWLADPGILDPWATGQIYFYYAGEAHPSEWPARNAAIEPGLIGLQYWFFYPYNYYPTLTNGELMNEAPIAGDVVNTDLHQGDWEHVTVLVDHRGRPQWLYMARHSDEGEYFRWDSPLLSFDEGHPVIQAAIGGHPSYDAHCGPRLRFAHGLKGIVSDWVVCGSGRFAFRASTTPLIDIAKTPWACWEGHFGVATHAEIANAKQQEGSILRAIRKYILVAGPRSPLWQAENGHLASDGPPAINTGSCANGASPQAAELAAIRSGIAAAGQHTHASVGGARR
jgi:hypothetical protein